MATWARPRDAHCHAQLMRNYLASRGSLGATDDELGSALGMLRTEARTLRAQLCAAGEVVASGAHRACRAGFPAAVWILAPAK